MKTKTEIIDQIKGLEQIINRSNIATANMAENRKNELEAILNNMKDYQLVDCDHLFMF